MKVMKVTPVSCPIGTRAVFTDKFTGISKDELLVLDWSPRGDLVKFRNLLADPPTEFWCDADDHRVVEIIERISPNSGACSLDTDGDGNCAYCYKWGGCVPMDNLRQALKNALEVYTEYDRRRPSGEIEQAQASSCQATRRVLTSTL